MSKRTILVISLVVLLRPSVALGQDEGGTDYQFRLLLHKHAIGDGSKFGLAGWWVVPDMTAEDNTFRSLVVGGLLYKQETRWVEFMGGGLVHQDGFVDPLINVRISERSFERVTIFADLEYFFRRERFYWWLGADTPIEIGKFKARIGIESENISFQNKPDSLGIGPRLIFPLPFYKKATLITAYEFRNDRNFLRHYLVINF